MWGYSPVQSLMTPQMLVPDPHYGRTAIHPHSALLHTSAIHPSALHHPSPPTMHPVASSTFHPLTIATSKSENMVSVSSSKPASREDPKVQLFIAPAVSGSVTALPASALAASQTPLASGIPSVLPAAALPSGLTQSLAPPLHPHYLYPPSSSMPIFCPKQSPLYPISALVPDSSTSLLSIMTTNSRTSTSSIDPRDSKTSISIADSTAVSCNPAAATSDHAMHQTALSLPTPPLVILSPGSTTKSSGNCSPSIKSSHKTAWTQNEEGIKFTTPCVSSPNLSQKLSLSYNADLKVPKLSHHRNDSLPNLLIKKEIKLENLSPQSVDKDEEIKCVDLSVPQSPKNYRSRELCRIKEESGVPDSDKIISNQRNVAVSSSFNSSSLDNQSVQVTCLRCPVPEDDSSLRKNYSCSTSGSSLDSKNVSSSTLSSGHSREPQHEHGGLPPVQDHPLDLSGLELLSTIGLKHANMLESVSSKPLNSLDESNSSSTISATQSKASPCVDGTPTRPYRDSGTSPHTVWSEPSYIIASDVQNSSCSREVAYKSCFPSISATNLTTKRSTPPAVTSEISGSSNPCKFEILCHLAEQRLYGTLEETKEDTKLCENMTAPVSSLEESNSNEMPGISCYANLKTCSTSISSHPLQRSFGSTTINEIPSTKSSKLQILGGETSKCDYTSYSAPLDLTLNPPKKFDSPINTSLAPPPTVSTITQTDEILFNNDPETSSKVYCPSLNAKLFPSNSDDSSSESQNFEGFDNTVNRMEEKRVPDEIAILEKPNLSRIWMDKVKKSKSKRKSSRPYRRERSNTEPNSRCQGTLLKTAQLEHSSEVVNAFPAVTKRRATVGGEGIPKLRIKGLKHSSTMKSSEIFVSPKIKTQHYHIGSSSDEGEFNSRHESRKKIHSRRWSGVNRTSSEESPTKLSLKRHFLPCSSHHVKEEEFDRHDADVSDIEEDPRLENLSDSSSRALYTETSVESSDHEAAFALQSSSKKRKPGRPRKHSPTKKDSTETIVAKKNKNINFAVPTSSIASSSAAIKSKLKPKLKAEVPTYCSCYQKLSSLNAPIFCINFFLIFLFKHS